MNGKDCKATLVWAIDFTKNSDRPATHAERQRLTDCLDALIASKQSPAAIAMAQRVLQIVTATADIK